MNDIDIGSSLQQAFNSFFEFLPRLLGFLIILLIGYVVARVVKGVLARILEKVGLDRALHSGAVGQQVNKVLPDARPSGLIASVAFWFIFLGFVAIAVSQLGIPALNNFVQAIGAYLPNIVAAILIFVVAGAIAAAIGGLVARTMGDTPTGKVVGSVIPVLVMAIATFMILNQLRIAPEIVTITYALLLGAAALAMALAFGLGGRDVASRMLSDAYEKGQQQRGQAKRDMEVGKQRGQADLAKAQDAAQSQTGTQSTGAVPQQRR